MCFRQRILEDHHRGIGLLIHDQRGNRHLPVHGISFPDCRRYEMLQPLPVTACRMSEKRHGIG
jgi:hypothetical protein